MQLLDWLRLARVRLPHLLGTEITLKSDKLLFELPVKHPSSNVASKYKRTKNSPQFTQLQL